MSGDGLSIRKDLQKGAIVTSRGEKTKVKEISEVGMILFKMKITNIHAYVIAKESYLGAVHF
jgi:hypothetical protein